MTLVASNAWVPEPLFWGSAGSPSFVVAALDAAADRVGAVFTAPKTGNISKIVLRFGTVTKDASTDLRVSLQDVDATTGSPDETDDAYRLVGNANILANTTFKTGILSSDGSDTGTKKAVTRGLRYAIVVKYETFVAADAIQIQGYVGGTRVFPNLFDYRVDNLTGAYAKQSSTVAAFSIEYDDGNYYYCPATFPVMVSGTAALNTGTTPDEIGLLFSRPYPGKLAGAWVGLDADGDFDLVWYDGTAGTRVASIDKDVRVTTVACVGYVPFESEVTFDANTTYVLAVKPTSVTSVTLHYFDVSAVAEFDQLAVGQGAFTYVTAKDPTTKADFTETTTRRPMIGVLLSALDDATGGATGGPAQPIRFVGPSATRRRHPRA